MCTHKHTCTHILHTCPAQESKETLPNAWPDFLSPATSASSLQKGGGGGGKELSVERGSWAHFAYEHFHVNRTFKGKCALSIDCINILSGVSGRMKVPGRLSPASKGKDKIRALLWKK